MHVGSPCIVPRSPASCYFPRPRWVHTKTDHLFEAGLGSEAEERIPELKSIAEWFAQWAKDIHTWDHNLIVLGDFNIDRKGDDLYNAFTTTGLYIPEDLHKVPWSIFGDLNKPHLEKFYDQIAWRF